MVSQPVRALRRATTRLRPVTAPPLTAHTAATTEHPARAATPAAATPTDPTATTTGHPAITGLYAVIGALSFASAGPFAAALQDTGWSPLAAVTMRILGTALILLGPTLWAMRGRWGTLRRQSRLVAGFGITAMGGAQLCFFQAIQYVDIGVALLIEYAAPIVVVAWCWLRRGSTPSAAVLLGTVAAVTGLLLVLDVAGVNQVHPLGLAWASGAALGAAGYFLIGAEDADGLPTVALVCGGGIVASAMLLITAAIGILPWHTSTAPATLAGTDLVWWIPAAGLILVSGTSAYWFGIASTRRLGARPASFLAYVELALAIALAAALVGQIPTGRQALGGAILLFGVAVVQWGEYRSNRRKGG